MTEAKFVRGPPNKKGKEQKDKMTAMRYKGKGEKTNNKKKKSSLLFVDLL